MTAVEIVEVLPHLLQRKSRPTLDTVQGVVVEPDRQRQLRHAAAERSKHAFCEGHHAPHSGI
jgi:hypothetical protein